MSSLAFPNQGTVMAEHNNQTLTSNVHFVRAFKKTNPLIHFPKISLYGNHHSHFQLCFSQRSYNTHEKPHSFVTKGFILITFSFALLSLRIVSTILLPEFPQRWSRLIAFSKQAESELMSNCPQHLIKAVVAYEDRRFFSHFGVDPVGVARAVLSLSSRGGGSTITQQVVMPHRRWKCHILRPQLLLPPNVTVYLYWSPISIKLVQTELIHVVNYKH